MDIPTALGYSAEVQAPNGQPVTEFMTDRWAQRVRADLEQVVREAKAEAWYEGYWAYTTEDPNPYRD